MGALKDLVNSEKGLIGVLLIIGVTVLASLDKVTFDSWQNYTLWIFGVYVGGKTVQGVTTTIVNGKTPGAPPAPTPTPEPVSPPPS